MSNPRKWSFLLLKVAFSVGMLTWVVRGQLARDGAAELWSRLEALQWHFWALAVCMQLVAIGFAVMRWRLLLRGQGIHAPTRFLAKSFLIGRFFGAFTPGGLGLDGWRLFDVGKRTGHYAKVTAVAGVEKILGQLAFGVVVLLGSFWGYQMIGVPGVLLVNGFFLVLVMAGLTLLSRPAVFGVMAGLMPEAVQKRVDTLVRAVSAYQGKSKLLLLAISSGIAVHVFNNLIYVCAALALGIDLNPLVVFFASSLQIMATLVPVSLNGLGIREATAAALYTSAAVGLSSTEALLIPLVGIAAEYSVSMFGIVPFMFRRGDQDVGIAVDDDAAADGATLEYHGDAARDDSAAPRPDLQRLPLGADL